MKLLRPLKTQVHALTLDSSKEGTERTQIAKSLVARVYFAHPYCSWERGTNENTNRLVRQYRKFELTSVYDDKMPYSAIAELD